MTSRISRSASISGPRHAGPDRTPTRFPLAALERTTGTNSATAMALRLGVARKQVYRWRDYGLDEWQADAMAIQLGHHPTEIWSDWR